MKRPVTLVLVASLLISASALAAGNRVGEQIAEARRGEGRAEERQSRS